MSNRHRLMGVANEELVAGLSELVQCNSLTAQVLAHLVELEERQLHLELGFTSLFSYCVEGLGMSEGTAGRRVTAMRVCRRFPDVFDRVARGELHFTADAELRELIERARELASHRVPKGDLASLMKLMVAGFVKQEEKRRFGIGARLRRTGDELKSSGMTEAAAPPGGAAVAAGASEATVNAEHPTTTRRHSRYLRMQVRREIHARDGGRCAYVSPDGRRCRARAFIQIDHVEPFSRNGSSDARNLRLLCMGHNLLHARKCFGKLHMAAKSAARSRNPDGARPR
jgi:hypothetical protein